jgi:patatin-like phospholipase/acyl hydrolase
MQHKVNEVLTYDSLGILDELMRKINPRDPPNPCDCFDLIGGTSTGGLIAIMLGRLRMTTTECRDAYRELSAEAFELRNYGSSCVVYALELKSQSSLQL